MTISYAVKGSWSHLSLYRSSLSQILPKHNLGIGTGQERRPLGSLPPATLSSREFSGMNPGCSMPIGLSAREWSWARFIF